MKKVPPAVVAVVVVLFAMLIDGAFGDPGKLVVLAQKSASGGKAHALAVAKTGKFDDVQVHVEAKPNQRVRAGWVKFCRGSGYTGRVSRDVRGRTPLSVPVELDALDTKADCRVVGDATLFKKGRLTVQLLAR
jgi:hypothetical protein